MSAAGTGAGAVAGVVALVEAGAGDLAATAPGAEAEGDAAALGGGDAGAGDAPADAGDTAGEPLGVGVGEAADEEAGLVLGDGDAAASSAGARFPMFDRSGPNLILPSITGRSKT